MGARRRIAVGATSLAALVVLALAGADAGSGIARSARAAGSAPIVTIPTTTTPATTPATSTAPTTPTPTTTTPTTTTISGAADNSAASQGFAYRLTVNEHVPGLGPLELTGSGTYSVVSRSGTGRFSLRYIRRTEQFQEIFLGTTFYLKEPPSVAAQLPGHKAWLKLDLSKAHGRYLKSLAGLLNSSSEDDPTQFLSYLSDESNGIHAVGPATVDGVSTTHYHASIDLARAGTGQPPAIRQASQKVLQSLQGQIVNEHAVPVDVWIDSSQLVRRARLALVLAPKGSPLSVTVGVTIDMPSYGPQATPSPPPAGQTLDLLGWLKSGRG